ncbi:hypothetical protein [Amycolatopsis thermophila]|uniref:Uncharacterized protein n=1 Tax=Amycolatopsis thermophila TaxID=206084 RepID=A0ABU0EMS5_9PSEU|nr:hypothetical protein [Amycolatopsis thermophila]MDQ0376573.1 hypothetical protein [Amycolatopsis thermophila]
MATITTTEVPVQSLLIGMQLDEGVVEHFSTLYLGDQVERVVAVRAHDGAVRALSFPWGTELTVFHGC